MTLFLKNWRLILILFVVINSFFLGYKYNDYRRDSSLLTKLTEEREELLKLSQQESSIAKEVQETLQSLQIRDRIIERERIKIVDRPVYNVECIDEDGLNLIKQYALGVSESDSKSE